MSSNAEWYIGHAVVELLVQERVVSMFSVIDILERRLQSGDSSKRRVYEDSGGDRKATGLCLSPVLPGVSDSFFCLFV